MGFEAAGYEGAFAFDTDEDSVATYRENLSSEKAQVADARDTERITRLIAGHVGSEPFVLAGGPPCQGFSQQGRGEAGDPRNNLVLRFAELATELPEKPAAVVLENVTYLDSERGEKVLASYLSKLRFAGYTVFRHDLSSADFGVPQLRRRIFVVALREGFAEDYEGPEPLTPGRWVTVGEAFSGLPDFSGRENPARPRLPFLTGHEPSNEGDLNKRRIAFVDMGGGRAWIPEHLQLDCHRGYGGHLDVYGRLDWFSQARTITGGFDSFTRGEYGHPFLHRSITPREGARLQGFPDWFSFEGNRASLRSQIGNAVPPPMAYAVAKAVKKTLGEKTSDRKQSEALRPRGQPGGDDGAKGNEELGGGRREEPGELETRV